MATHPRLRQSTTRLVAIASFVLPAALVPFVWAGADDDVRIERRRLPAQPVILSQPSRAAVVDRATVRQVFKLGSVFGDRETLDVVLPRSGVIRVRVDWRGTTERLAVILNGPGQTGYYARHDGAAPVEIEFDVTEELFRRGAKWRVSVVNFSRRGSSVGRIVVDYPAMLQPLARMSPSLQRIGEAARVQPAPPAGEPERSILPDGRVQIRYPDGTIKIFGPGCGFTVINPDNTAMSVECFEVQPASLPGLPSDPDLRSFLEAHRDHLLQQISRLVDFQQDQIDLYLGYESENATGLFEQIQMRMRLIDNLLQ